MFVVNKSDYESLAGFLSENEPSGKSREYWLSRFNFWWDINSAFQEKMERGWVIKENNEIIGFVGAIPTFFQVNGEKKTVFNGTTWVVNPEFRGEQSVGLYIKALENAKGTAYFDTTSTGKIAKIKILSKFKYMFTPKGVKDYLYIIHPNKLVDSKIKNSFVSFIISLLFLPVNFIIKFFVSIGLRNRKEAFQIQYNDNDFEDLWERTSELYSNTNIRNSESLNWMITKFPGTSRIVLGCYENDKLLGFAVCLDASERNIKKLLCIDVWYDFKNDEIPVSLMKGCIKYGKDNSFDVVVMPGFNTKIEKVFKKLVFFIRSGKNYFYKFDPKETISLTSENTYFVYLQGDFGLY